jgi:hypothetical protein
MGDKAFLPLPDVGAVDTRTSIVITQRPARGQGLKISRALDELSAGGLAPKLLRQCDSDRGPTAGAATEIPSGFAARACLG